MSAPHAPLYPGQPIISGAGRGAGLDSLLAARRVGPTGKVVGVDLCPGMTADSVAGLLKRWSIGRSERTLVADLVGTERKGLTYGWYNVATGLATLPSWG
jgi:hypothetical protein